MGREEGGGFRMGNICIPVVDSFLYLAKLIQFVKFKKKKMAQVTKQSGPSDPNIQSKTYMSKGSSWWT